MKTAQKFATYYRFGVTWDSRWVQGLGWLTRQQILCMHYDCCQVPPPPYVARRHVIDNLCSRQMHDFGPWGLFHASMPAYEIVPKIEPVSITPILAEAYRYRECLHGCGTRQRQAHTDGKIEDFRHEPWN